MEIQFRMQEFDNYYDGNENDQPKIIHEERYIPYVTYALAGLNIIVFILELMKGDPMDPKFMLKMGGACTPYILGKGEWYRMISSMFLHYGFKHFFFNMIALVAIGRYIEIYFGRVKYFILYMVSGLMGNLVFLFSDLLLSPGGYTVSAGASGAISGLFGALLVLAIDKNTKQLFPLPRVIFGIMLLIIPGIGDSTINVAAHIGGAICGVVIGFLYYFFSKRSNKQTTF